MRQAGSSVREKQPDVSRPTRRDRDRKIPAFIIHQYRYQTSLGSALPWGESAMVITTMMSMMMLAMAAAVFVSHHVPVANA